ncbi:MAG: hypothetical protein QGH37_17975 [Candidatus Poribacteria bacterium]|nr:hypothetical protein [Candidatus Poribacteria bacterium]
MDRPNILFILTDQQSVRAMSCTGNPHLCTPHMDALSASGTRFGLLCHTGMWPFAQQPDDRSSAVRDRGPGQRNGADPLPAQYGRAIPPSRLPHHLDRPLASAR